MRSRGENTLRRGVRNEQRHSVFQRVLLELENTGAAELRSTDAVRTRIGDLLSQNTDETAQTVFSPAERASLEESVLAEMCGLGPLEPLLADPSVSDVLVNGPGEIWVDRYGRLEKTRVRFDDEQHLMRIIDRMVSAHGRHLEEATPYVDARLPDGSRVHAMIAPISSLGPVLAIRRPRQVPLTMEDLLAAGTLTEPMATILKSAAECGLNILISGGAAAGKTTLLNVLAGFIPKHERLITVEETAELKLNHPHVIPLETRMPNIDNRGGIPLSTLIRNALRMRADRIIVGEVRGTEVLDMLQAMNLGHNGSLTTLHANGADEALQRLGTLLLSSGVDFPGSVTRSMINGAFQLVVQLHRDADGTRRVVEISEVDLSGDVLRAVPIFVYDTPASGERDGRHVPTGQLPKCLDRLRQISPNIAEVFRVHAEDSSTQMGDER